MFDASRLRRFERSASAFPCTPNKRCSNANAASPLKCVHLCRFFSCRPFAWSDDLILAKALPTGCMLFIPGLTAYLSAAFGWGPMLAGTFFLPAGHFLSVLAGG